jgi:methylated-DNA-[protein]-cysteine S-methyltransferase
MVDIGLTRATLEPLMKTAGTFATPFGPAAAILDENGALCEFSLSQPLAESEDVVRNDAALREVARQVREYCEGERREFNLDLEPAGTEFQRTVWQELLRIPYGETISYATLAMRIGRPAGASRAVGQANGANPIALIIPCHRVIGADGTLTGYGGGLPLKQALLEFERRTRGFAEPQLALALDG